MEKLNDITHTALIQNGSPKPQAASRKPNLNNAAKVKPPKIPPTSSNSAMVEYAVPDFAGLVQEAMTLSKAPSMDLLGAKMIKPIEDKSISGWMIG